MGYDWRSKYVCLFMWTSQVAATWFVSDKPWWVICVVAYAFGAVMNHSMLLAIHEMSHNLFFKAPLANRLFSLFVNLPMVLPAAITFKKYHLEHHRYQGYAGIDVDVPSHIEGRIFQGMLLKLIWVATQGFWYAFRPLLIRPKPASLLEALNWLVCLSFDAAVVYLWGWPALAYLGLCDFFGMGLHPVAGHFIAEHYSFDGTAETYSYYGPLKWLIFNVGYHVEHHDFPSIPGSRLYRLREIAPEFYNHLPYHTSYTAVIWNYITDPKMSPYSRMTRSAEDVGKTIDEKED